MRALRCSCRRWAAWLEVAVAGEVLLEGLDPVLAGAPVVLHHPAERLLVEGAQLGGVAQGVQHAVQTEVAERDQQAAAVDLAPDAQRLARLRAAWERAAMERWGRE